MAKKDLLLLAINPSPALDLMDRALRAAGFEVVIVRDEAEMEKAIQDAIPALMIVAEKFAGLDGFSITTKQLERFPTLPVILYAEKDKPELAKQALYTGMVGYIYPPLKTDDIVKAVKASFNRANQLGDWVRREVKRTTSSLEQKAKISEAERNKLEGIISNIQDGLIVLDEKRNILLLNRSVREIFSLNGNNVIGMEISQVIHNEDLIALLERSTEGPLKYHEINFDDGRVFNAQYTPLPKIGAAVTMQDISYIKEIDRLKSEFVHTISHDLRSPLTSILGYAELVSRSGPLNDSQQEFMQRLQDSVQHVATLINDLLDLGRLEAGFDTRREPTQLDELLAHTLNMLDGQIHTKQIRLVKKIVEPIKPLRANPIRMRQMLDNLVGNAVKYTPENGHVGISLMMQEDQIIFKVEDSGPGIPTEEQPHVFEKFYRASNAPEGVKGSGLGLAIVKSIVESHQGRVWVESAVGKGSTFTVLLPAHA